MLKPSEHVESPTVAPSAARRFRDLRHGELWTSRGSHGPLTIELKAGSLWITAAGDVEDYLLAPGQSFAGDARQLIVAEALEDSTVCVSARSS